MSTDGIAHVLGSLGRSTNLTGCTGQTAEGIFTLKSTVVRIAASVIETWLCPTPLPSSKVQMSCMGCWTGQQESAGSGSGQEAATGPAEAGCGPMLLLQFPGKSWPGAWGASGSARMAAVPGPCSGGVSGGRSAGVHAQEQTAWAAVSAPITAGIAGKSRAWSYSRPFSWERSMKIRTQLSP